MSSCANGSSDCFQRNNWLHSFMRLLSKPIACHAALFSSIKPGKSTSTLHRHRALLDYIGQQLDIKTQEDWYNVKQKDLFAHGARSILKKHYNGSPAQAITTIYSDLQWDLLKFMTHRPKEYWNDKKNQLDFIKEISGSRYLDLRTFDSWYQVKAEKIIDYGGRSLLELYNNSLEDILRSIYPEHPWKTWRFAVVPSGYWKSKENQRQFLDDVGMLLGVEIWKDWYNIDGKDVFEFGGRSLLEEYGSYINAVTSVYSEHPWLKFKFKTIPKHFYQDRSNQRLYFDELFFQFDLKSWKDWYSVLRSDITQNRGSHILDLYDGSHIKAIMTLYPEYTFEPMLFKGRDEGYWKDKEHQKAFLDRLFKNLGLKAWEDWYRVKTSDVILNGGTTILSYYGGSLVQTLMEVYPDHKWNPSKMQSPSGTSYFNKSQLHLFHLVKGLFPDISDVHLDFLHPDLRYSESNRPMELDVFIPSLRLAFEYQGDHHYRRNPFYQSDKSSQDQMNRDKEKVNACQKAGFTLVVIPSTWNGSKESLLSYIHEFRPELMIKIGQT